MHVTGWTVIIATLGLVGRVLRSPPSLHFPFFWGLACFPFQEPCADPQDRASVLRSTHHRVLVLKCAQTKDFQSGHWAQLMN